VRKEIFFVIILVLFPLIAYRQVFAIFFAQDDFVLINHFSQNSFWVDISNVFGVQGVTHWRPLHNFYFFLGGNLFGKNYFAYHALTLALHIGCGFLIYKIGSILMKDRKIGLSAAILYSIHPAHFVSLNWISGGATVIGFFFLLASLYSYITERKSYALIFYFLSLLASEAMLTGLGIYLAYELLFKKKKFDKSFLVKIVLISACFLFLKLILFTPPTINENYQFEISMRAFGAVKYYLLRILGFAEISRDFITSLILGGLLLFILKLAVWEIYQDKTIKIILFSILITVTGLFPFILIPNHLSPHYMNVSIFGFSMIISFSLRRLKQKVILLVLSIFTVIFFINITLTSKNNWVIRRSSLAQYYINEIELQNPDAGSMLTFTDNQTYTSFDAYITLGTGEAINFWFKDKNYKTCFVKFELCTDKGFSF